MKQVQKSILNSKIKLKLENLTTNLTSFVFFGTQMEEIGEI
jgi:hypothetical protein